MSGLNINLLPKQVLEKRQAEKRLTWAIFGFVALCVLVSILYGFNLIRSMNEESKLEALKAENLRYEREIAKITDFESDKLSTEALATTVVEAIRPKYKWAGLMNNLSLIIPNEVWLTGITVKDGEIMFTGSAQVTDTELKMAHQAVAKWLVRQGEIDDLTDIWLTRSEKMDRASTFGPPSAETPGDLPDESDEARLEFTSQAAIKYLKELKELEEGAPAPPNPGGKT